VRSILITALCALCVSAVLYPQLSTASENDALKQVVVKRGDTLSALIKRETGLSGPVLWQSVAEYNGRTVDQPLEIGDVIVIPPGISSTEPVVVLREQTDQTSQTRETPSVPAVEEKAATVIVFEEQIVTSTGDSNQPTDEQSPESVTVEPAAGCEGQVCFEEQSTTSDVETAPKDQVRDGAVAEKAPATDNSATEEPEAPAQTEVTEDTSVPTPAPEPVPPKRPDNQKPASSEPAAPPPAQTTAAQVQPEAPKPKPGLFEVDEEAAVRALERSLIQLNALLLRPGRAEVAVSYDFGFDKESEPVLVSLEDTSTGETTTQVGQQQREVSSNSVDFDVKLGLPYDSQISLSVPFGSSRQDIGLVVSGTQGESQQFSSDGFGDVVVSIDKTLAREKGRRPDIILSAAYDSDSGSADTGSGAQEFTLGVTATKRQDPLVFTANLSRTFSQKTDEGVRAGDVTQFSLGTLLAASPYTSLQFLFSQALIDSAEIDGESISDSDAKIASFSAGVSSVVAESMFLNAQLRFGLVDSGTDYRLTFSLAKQFSY